MKYLMVAVITLFSSSAYSNECLTNSYEAATSTIQGSNPKEHRGRAHCARYPYEAAIPTIQGSNLREHKGRAWTKEEKLVFEL